MKSGRLLIAVWAVSILSILAVLYANSNFSVRCQLVCPSYIHHSGNSITFSLPRIEGGVQPKTLILLYSGGATILNSNKSSMFGLKSPESPGFYNVNISYGGANLFAISFIYVGGLEYIPYVLIGISIFMSITLVSEYLSFFSNLELYVGDSVYGNPTPYSSNAVEIERAIETIRNRLPKYKKIRVSELLSMMRGMHDFNVSPSKEIIEYMLGSAEDKHMYDGFSRPLLNNDEICYDLCERRSAANFNNITGFGRQKTTRHHPKTKSLPIKVISMMNRGAEIA